MDNKDYINLVNFWNSNFKLEEKDKKEIIKQINPDYFMNFSPSKKQFDCLMGFKNYNHVLDYGCGSGWASIIIAKSGAKKVNAVDVSSNSIEMTNFYKMCYQVEDQIDAFFIDEKWLSEQKEGGYDALFSSNVIDVVPLEMAKNIVKECYKVVNKNARVVFSLNYYIDPKIMLERGCKVDGPHIYIDGILRLTSLKDEERLEIFKPYFALESLSYYAWQSEKKEMRRLFTLKPLK